MAIANNSDEFDYEIWAPATKTTLIEKEVWDVVENGILPDPSKIPELAATIGPEELSKWRDLAAKDMKAIQILKSSLPDSVSKKTLSASSAKEVWDLLQKGNEEAKVRRLEKQFEEISMRENESTDSYHDRVNEIVEELRLFKIEICEFEFLKKLLASSSSGPCDSVVALLKELTEVHNMNLMSIVECLFSLGHGYKPITEELLLLVLKEMRNMWIVSGVDMFHMTPFEKYFTNLDRTHKAKVELEDGTFTMVEGKGDVKIMMKEGKKKTIGNVLLVPGIKRNVLSVSQLESRGYSMSEGEGGGLIIRDRTGAEFGETMWVGKELALRMRVIEGNLAA